MSYRVDRETKNTRDRNNTVVATADSNNKLSSCR